MHTKPPHNVVVVVDGPDPDNFACILAASSMWANMNVVAVIMTGRPVCAAQGAKPYVFSPAASRAVNRDNALHAKGMLLRHGREHIPVFAGLRAPFTTIRHDLHIRESITDAYDDAHAGHQLAGGIDEAIIYLAGIPGTLHFVCGGPLTDIAYLLQQPMLHGKFGLLTTQLGFFGSPGIQVLGGRRRQFNATAHAKAAHDTLFDYPGPVYLTPTDITKLATLGFKSVDDIAAWAAGGAPALQEIVEMYRKAWPHMWGKMQIDAHVHDFHPAELMSLLLAQLDASAPHHLRFSPKQPEQVGRYRITPTGIGAVPYLEHEMERWGEIDLTPYLPNSPKPPRFWASGIETAQHREILFAALNSPAYAPTLLPS